jgi:hypothetical protein
LRRSRRLRPSWRRADSNRRPPACKAGALPAELRPPVCLRRLRTTTLYTAPTVDHFTAPDRLSRMRDADMSISTGQSVGDVRPRFISLHEGLHLTRSFELRTAGLAVKLGKEQAVGITAPAPSEDRSTRDRRAEPPSLVGRKSLGAWWDGVRAEPGPVYACSMAAVAITCPVGEVTARLSKRVRSA